MEKLKEANQIKDDVKDYYGEQLSSTSDLKTTACCTNESIPNYLKKAISDIHPEILDKFYGCGSPIPLAIENKTVLDLGCGTGRDVYLASLLVGEKGKSIGVDMTENQIKVAKQHINYHTKKYNYAKPNVEFIQGSIEKLEGIADNSIDVIISNCVINLSPNKEAVFKEIFRVLKPGGELYFSDVFSDRRIPVKLINDPTLYGECLSGSLYTEDFRRMIQKAGCLDYRNLTQRVIDVENKKLENLLGNIVFYSITVRAFKLDTLEDICEDYGQVAIYKGGIPHSPHKYVLDDHHTFYAHKPKLVCGNTASMLEETRLSKYFEIIGNRNKHYGDFDCKDNEENNLTESGSCC